MGFRHECIGTSSTIWTLTFFPFFPLLDASLLMLLKLKKAWERHNRLKTFIKGLNKLDNACNFNIHLLEARPRGAVVTSCCLGQSLSLGTVSLFKSFVTPLFHAENSRLTKIILKAIAPLNHFMTNFRLSRRKHSFFSGSSSLKLSCHVFMKK